MLLLQELNKLLNNITLFQFLKKLNRQERVVEEVKFVLKPYYNKKRVTKEEYKDILRRAVPKVSLKAKYNLMYTLICAILDLS